MRFCFDSFGSRRAIQATLANVGLAQEFKADHEIPARLSIADENLAERYRSNLPLADFPDLKYCGDRGDHNGVSRLK